MLPDTIASKKYPSERSSWKAAKTRALSTVDPSYHNYGGRGIAFCDRWFSFAKFMEDMGPKPSPMHSLDRIDVNGNYEPGNCRWATKKVQQNNRRDNRKYEYNGKHLTVSELADLAGVAYHVMAGRLNHYKWPVERAVTTPVLNFSDAGSCRTVKPVTTLSHNGTTMTVREWSQLLGMKAESLRGRLKRMSVEDALSTPRRSYPLHRTVKP